MCDKYVTISVAMGYHGTYIHLVVNSLKNLICVFVYAYIRTDPRWPLPRPWSPVFNERVHYLPRFFHTSFWSHHTCSICLVSWGIWDRGKCYENSYGVICESKHSNIRMCEAMLSRCTLSADHTPWEQNTNNIFYENKPKTKPVTDYATQLISIKECNLFNGL